VNQPDRLARLAECYPVFARKVRATLQYVEVPSLNLPPEIASLLTTVLTTQRLPEASIAEVNKIYVACGKPSTHQRYEE